MHRPARSSIAPFHGALPSRGWGRRAPRRQRGIALALTLLALAMAFILAMGFLAAQSTTVGMGQNVDRQAVAACIAQSGLLYGLAHIQNDSTWRTDNSNGVWISAQPLNGGTITLKGEDGTYNSTTGTVSGTGSLTSSNSDPVVLTATGTYQGVTVVLHQQITPTVSALPAQIASVSSVSLSGSATIDAFNSANGAYGGNNVLTSQATVATNATGSGVFAMSGEALIKGNASVGPNANTSTAYNIPTWATFVTGTRSTLSSVVNATTPAAPTNTGSSLGALSVTNITQQTISSNGHYSSFTLDNSGILTISGNVTMLIDGDVNIGGASKLIINSGSSLTLAVGGNFTITNSGQANLPAANPAMLQISMLTSGKNMTLSGAIGMYAAVDMPLGQLYVTGSGVFYGTAICGTFVADGAALIHLDVNPNLAPPGTSGTGITTYTYKGFQADQP